jgi:small subunit ribosomal protein S17
MTGNTGRYGGRKVREGTVVSDKMQKTVLVAVESNIRHPLYKKIVRRVRRFMAHDEAEDARLGDRVRIVESRPLSRRKRWRVVEVLSRAELPEVAAESIDLDLLGEVKKEEPEAVATAEEPEATGAGAIAEAVPAEGVVKAESAAEAEAAAEPEEVRAPESLAEEEATTTQSQADTPAAVAEAEETAAEPVGTAHSEDAETKEESK